MKVAVAGTGPVAHYLFEELRNHGHELVVLTRLRKPGRDFDQRETDYSLPSLVSALHDCEALISTVATYTDPSISTNIHLAMLEACQQSPKCKTYIPSEWGGDSEQYPDEPSSLADSNRVLHGKLANAKDIRSTIICNSWFSDYIVPASHRYLRDVGPLWPMNHDTKVFTIYGPGTQVVDFVPVRDVARAVAALLVSNEPWERYTFVSGTQLSWNDLYSIIKRRDPAWTSVKQSLASTIKLAQKTESPEEHMQGQFELLSYSGLLRLPRDKVQAQRTKYFPLLHFRTVEELLDNVHAAPNQIV